MLFGVCFSYHLPKLCFKDETCPPLKLHALDDLKYIQFDFINKMMILRKFVPLKYSTGLQETPLKSVHTVVRQNPEWFVPLPVAEACETQSVNSE